MHELDLSWNPITWIGATSLRRGLANCDALVSLNMSYCPLGDDGIAKLASWISTTTALKLWQIRSCKFGEHGAQRVANAIPTSRLEKVTLSFNAVGHRGGLALAQALVASRTLRVLWAENCSIGSEPAISIAHACTSNRSLEELNLAFNDLDPAVVAPAFVHAFKSSKCRLALLDLGNNPKMSKDAATLLLASIATCSRKVDLRLISPSLNAKDYRMCIERVVAILALKGATNATK